MSPPESVGERQRRPALRVDVLSIFPEAILSYCEVGVLGRAWRQGVLDLRVHDLRAGASDERRSVDDAPYGGGAGMVLSPEPVFAAVELFDPPRPLYLLSPSGRVFDQHMARALAASEGGFSLLCGRYEGVDQRIVEHLADGEISVGDYVLAGGELAALVVVEAVCRLLPEALGNEHSLEEESFSLGLLEYPQYTRPAEFRGETVPEVLRSGDHARVAAWRLAASLHRTLERRPDLITARGGLSRDEARLLSEHGYPLPTAGTGEDGTSVTGAEPREERDQQ
jgi:tRNA (guanine37-N1)-methyltransferase